MMCMGGFMDMVNDMSSFDKSWALVKEEVDVYGNSPTEERFQHPTYIRRDSSVSQMFGDGKPLDEQVALLNVIIQYPTQSYERGNNMYGQWRNQEHEEIPNWQAGSDGDYFHYFATGGEDAAYDEFDPPNDLREPTAWRWQPVIDPDTNEPQQKAKGSYEFYSPDGRWYEEGGLEFIHRGGDGRWELIDAEGSLPDFVLDRLNKRGYDVSGMQSSRHETVPGYGGVGDHWKDKK